MESPDGMTAATGVWIGFAGHVSTGEETQARRFEDEVLRLVPHHGGAVHFRGIRRDDEPSSAPFEFQVIRFPSESAFDDYLRDPDRIALVERYGPVFTSKVATRVQPIVALTR